MGKKFIIELCEKPMKNENGNDIWRVKGFNTLVFDQNGLDKLEEYKEPKKETPDGSQYTMLTRLFKEKAVFMYHSDHFEAFLKGDFT